MKKMIALALALSMALCLTACGADTSGQAEAVELRFSDSVSVERIEELAGQTVTMIGYMATMSPISGEYMYLMNMPYQSCPFCVPNTTQLSNTMAVYAPDGKRFEYTDQAIQVKGTLLLEECVDEFGYVYNYRIADASYEVVDLSTVSEEYALWQTIASDGIIDELNSMFNYLHFLCQWTEYQGSYTEDSGEVVTFYMYPGDVTHYLETEGPIGYAEEQSEDYFRGLVARIRAISADQLEDLVEIVEESQTLAGDAMEELNAGEYVYDEESDRFTLNNGDALYERWYDVYVKFSEWMTRWEL